MIVPLIVLFCARAVRLRLRKKNSIAENRMILLEDSERTLASLHLLTKVISMKLRFYIIKVITIFYGLYSLALTRVRYWKETMIIEIIKNVFDMVCRFFIYNLYSIKIS